jgi:predicted nucleic acid-binding protein
MSKLHFFDTNILLYSISRDPMESAKREQAIQLLDQDDGALSVQVFQEFYVQATRASRLDAIPHEIAVALIGTWKRFAIQDISLAILTAALDIKATHGFSYWDSAIIAAARALGCRELYSEDMAHGREIEGVRIINPFR